MLEQEEKTSRQAPRRADGAEVDRLRAENARLAEALRGSELLFSSFMENLPDRCLLLDSDLRYRYISAVAASSPYIDPRAAVGEPVRPVREGGSEGILERYRGVLRTGEPFMSETTICDAEGTERQFSVRAFKAGELLGLVWTDVTDARRSEVRLSAAEAELRALAQHILEVREEERKSLARELHDELGQALTAIEMELRAVARSHKGLGEGQRRLLEDLLATTGQSIRSVQRLCSELRPAVLDSLGLREAIEWLAQDVSSRCSLRSSSRIGVREGAIGPRASIALFRITQESLTNVVRHAGASSFEIELREEGAALRLGVRDDGVGISEAQATAPGSFGIQGIRERARSLGGSVSIRGEPGRGTILELSIPLPPDGRLP